MRKLKIFFITFFTFINFCIINNVFAATNSTTLITVGSGQYRITVTETTTVQDIINVLGQPKIKTVSAFGGEAYTFYTDDDYNNYLYIETTSTGSIISYGSVDKTYVTTYDSYGSKYEFNANRVMQGAIVTSESKVVGGVFYNMNAMPARSKDATSVIDLFTDIYSSNPIKYTRAISEHAVTMYNALSTNLGNKCNLIFDEDLFYTNEQFVESGTSVVGYLDTMGKSSYYRRLGVQDNVEISKMQYYVLNPMLFAQYAASNLGVSYSDKPYAIFSYSSASKKLTVLTISEDTFKILDSVSLTADEQSKLAEGRYEYMQAIENLNRDKSIYSEEPDISSASTLKAGKLTDLKISGITHYINAIRTAGGLPRLIADDSLFTMAQHIATLLTYRITALNLNIKHRPEQPTGVSDEYYNIALGSGKSYAENLNQINNNPAVTTSVMMQHINLFLSDTFENPQLFSHRQRILNAKFTNWGYGINSCVGSNEFSGTKASSTFLEAWPSNGVTFMETIADTSNLVWTAQFTSKYTILDSTTAKIVRLNDNKEWNFDRQAKEDNYWFARSINSTGDTSNRVIMYDSTLIPSAGSVYEVTLYNVKDNATGATTNYTYRSIFEYADEEKYPTNGDSLSIELPKDIVKVAGEEVYYIPLGEELKLTAKIGANVDNKKVTWVSSNPLVTVTQNGTVIANSLLSEDVTITVGFDGTNITSSVVLRPYRKLERVELSQKSISCTAQGSSATEPVAVLNIVYMPDDATEIKKIEWKVVSEASPDIDYDINDPTITKYIRVVVDPSNPESVSVYPIDAEVGNNVYTVKVIVKGISGEYTGTCRVTIRVPIKELEIRGRSSGNGFSPIPGNTRTLTIDYNQYNNRYFDLAAVAKPSNTTDSTDVTWHTGDANIVTVYGPSSKGESFRIDKEGVTTITAKSVADPNVTDTITVDIKSKLTSLNLSGVANQSISSNETKNDQLTLNRVPEIDTDEVKFTSNNNDIASVDDNGLVTFKAPGNVTISAASVQSPSIKTSFTYSISMLIDSLVFPAEEKEVNKNQEINVPVQYSPLNASNTNYIEYSSNNNSVARVDARGNVLGLSVGEATITASIIAPYSSTGKKISATYKIYVKSPLRSVSIGEDKKVTIGSNYNFSLTLNPIDATDEYTVTWSSLNPEIVEIDPNTGIATAMQIGDTDITATVYNKTNKMTYTATCNVEVVDYIKGDMDRDGKVNSKDAALVLDRFKNNDATDIDMAIGDIDGKGQLNAEDAANILDLFKFSNEN